jgi:putative transposase
MDYRYGSHTVYNIAYHFVWVTKYRDKVLTGDVALRVRELVRQTCAIFEIKILKGVVRKDPVHIRVSTPLIWRRARSCAGAKDAARASSARSSRC